MVTAVAALADLVPRGLLLRADTRDRPRAPRSENASAPQIVGVGRLAMQPDRPMVQPLDIGNGGEQRLGVGMQRRRVDTIARPLLHDRT